MVDLAGGVPIVERRRDESRLEAGEVVDQLRFGISEAIRLPGTRPRRR
jgi:hypothetical protein